MNIEDIPFLKNNPHGTFLLEVGVAKVAFSDGTTWEAGVTPGKFDYAKVLERSRQSVVKDLVGPESHLSQTFAGLVNHFARAADQRDGRSLRSGSTLSNKDCT